MGLILFLPIFVHKNIINSFNNSQNSYFLNTFISICKNLNVQMDFNCNETFESSIYFIFRIIYFHINLKHITGTFLFRQTLQTFDFFIFNQKPNSFKSLNSLSSLRVINRV